MDTLTTNKQPETRLDELATRPDLIQYGKYEPLSLNEMLMKVGNSPLVLLNEQGENKLYGKIEGINPTRSLKARTAAYMLRNAVEKREIDRSKGIVIGSGGNFAIAMAALCRAENIPLTVSLLSSAPEPFVRILEEFNSQVVRDSTTRDERREVTLSLADQGYCFLDQHNSPTALLAIGQTLAPEIMKQTSGKVTDIVAGFGTGMTIFGTSIYFQKRYQEGSIKNRVNITAVEDDLSLLDFHMQSLAVKDGTTDEKERFLRDYENQTGRRLRLYRKKGGEFGKVIFYIGDRGVDDIPGIGISGLQPAAQQLLQMNLIDSVYQVTPVDAYQATKELQNKGLNVGISSGATYLAAQKLFEKRLAQNENTITVAIFADTGDLYQQKLKTL